MNSYKGQVTLLLNVLPEVAKQNYFALHRGTPINTFIKDMPRLSVDIDVTYIPLEERATSMNNIIAKLKALKLNIEKLNLGLGSL